MSAIVTSAVITRERPDTPDAIDLITELDAYLEAHYPLESRHGFSVDRLLAEDVAFFLLRSNGTPAGCGGIKLVGGEYGEIKRMYVAPEARGLGLARQLLAELERLASGAGADWMVLESCREVGLPVCVTIAGGYGREVRDTVRVHVNTVRLVAQFA